ncbi:MAG TPA: hypothetical protein VE989_13395 [Sphingomicrobium sp.]|nr:hypothetical protein [Sphingomicrobium sp.]
MSVHQILIDISNWSTERWFVEIVGWGGAVLILLAYLLLSAGRLTGQSLAYQLMNVLGAAGFIINGWWHRAIPSATLNVIWLLIGAIATWQIIKKRGSSTSAM